MGFFSRRKQDKLYRQWVEHAGLPHETVPQQEVAGDRLEMVERKGKLYQFRERILRMTKRLLRV